jgi:hypothetical protein
MRSAVLPSVQPNCEKPTNEIAAAPATAPQTAGLIPGWIFIAVPLVSGKEFSLIDYRLVAVPSGVCLQFGE